MLENILRQSTINLGEEPLHIHCVHYLVTALESLRQKLQLDQNKIGHPKMGSYRKQRKKESAFSVAQRFGPIFSVALLSLAKLITWKSNQGKSQTITGKNHSSKA